MAALATRLASLFLTTALLFGMAVPAASAASYESDALALLNSARAAAGLAPVSVHSDLTDDALAWSRQMQDDGSLSHNPNLAAVTTDWDKLGENVGLGTSVSALHQAFMDSPSHRGNILGDYDYVGIAVVEETSSKLWITVVFMKSLGSVKAPVDEPEPYAEEQLPVGNGEPVAAPASSPAVAAKPAPAASAVPAVPMIVYVRVSGAIAD